MAAARVTTAAELDALPVGSRYLDRFHDVGEIIAPGIVRYPETADLTTSYAARYLPATLLHDPAAPIDSAASSVTVTAEQREALERLEVCAALAHLDDDPDSPGVLVSLADLDTMLAMHGIEVRE